MGMATAVGTEAGVGGVAASLSTLFLPIAHDERSVLAFSSLHESAVQAELGTPSLPGPIHLSLLNYVVVFVTMKRGKKGGDGDRQLLLCSDIFLSCSIAKAPQIFAGFY